MSESPLFVLLIFGGAVYLFKIWWNDYKGWKYGNPNEGALPGATGVPSLALWIGAIGAVFLVAVETGGEMVLGVSAEQTDITAIMLLAFLGAGIIEELVFRGYLVVTNKGRTALVLSVVGFSLLFALAHYQYYTDFGSTEEETRFALVLDPKSLWSLLLLFLNSLWFYTVRFFKWNPLQSLLPCFVAHISSNLAVFVVKALQGHVTAPF